MTSLFNLRTDKSAMFSQIEKSVAAGVHAALSTLTAAQLGELVRSPFYELAQDGAAQPAA